ncbi:MAG: hypothetical protein V1911_03885 [Candidatus Micrarchaeota archaeon]
MIHFSELFSHLPSRLYGNWYFPPSIVTYTVPSLTRLSCAFFSSALRFSFSLRILFAFPEKRSLAGLFITRYYSAPIKNYANACLNIKAGSVNIVMGGAARWKWRKTAPARGLVKIIDPIIRERKPTKEERVYFKPLLKGGCRIVMTITKSDSKLVETRKTRFGRIRVTDLSDSVKAAERQLNDSYNQFSDAVWTNPRGEHKKIDQLREDIGRLIMNMNEAEKKVVNDIEAGNEKELEKSRQRLGDIFGEVATEILILKTAKKVVDKHAD